MQNRYLLITLGHAEPLTLEFLIRKSPVAELWLDRMSIRGQWPMDNRSRFYNFNARDKERAYAETYIKQCIETINNHRQLITRPFEWTQDCLNYLHNIFEVHHGLLDQQTSEYWQTADDSAKSAIGELNVAVHRCETFLASPGPRFVCTWYGMPKTCQLSHDLQREYGTSQINFGTVYLNYCEIGKTVEDLEFDNDEYIDDEAFRPFSHYSADFSVRFYNQDLSQKHDQIQRYIDKRRDFFLAKNITSVYNIKAQPLRFPVADLMYSGNKKDLLLEISKRQWISQIEIK